MINRFLCKLIGHARSKKSARLVGYNWRSACLFCGTKLVRLDSGSWRPVDKVRWVNTAKKLRKAPTVAVAPREQQTNDHPGQGWLLTGLPTQVEDALDAATGFSAERQPASG